MSSLSFFSTWGITSSSPVRVNFETSGTSLFSTGSFTYSSSSNISPSSKTCLVFNERGNVLTVVTFLSGLLAALSLISIGGGNSGVCAVKGGGNSGVCAVKGRTVSCFGIIGSLIIFYYCQ